MNDDKQKLVIVKWNVERIKVLPIIPNLMHVLKNFSKNDPNRKHKKKALYLTFGNNYIPAIYWEQCKEHDMIKLEIKSGNIEEVIQDDPKIKVQLNELNEQKEELVQKKDDIEYEYEPEEIAEFRKKIEELEKEIKKTKTTLKRTKDETKLKEKKEYIAECEKEIQELKLKIPDSIDEQIKDIEKEEKEILSKITEYNSFKIKEREKIILETYDIRSLEKYLEVEMDGQLRLKIENQIKSVKEDKNDKTIGHPKSHTKVS